MDFASRVTVVCFGASYGLGLAFELLRIFWPGKGWRWAATAGVLAGLFAQSLFLLHRGWEQQRLPIGTTFDSIIMLSWLVTWAHLYLLVRNRRLASGLFFLPISLGLVLYGSIAFDRGEPPLTKPATILVLAHGVAYLLGVLAGLAAALAAMMYLWKRRQLRLGPGVDEWFGMRLDLRLPSLERLDTVNSVAVLVAWPLLTLGIGLGLALGTLAWTDPKVITSLVGWGLYTVLTHARIHPENRGRRVAWLTLVATVFLLVSVLGDPFLGSGHQELGGRSP